MSELCSVGLRADPTSPARLQEGLAPRKLVHERDSDLLRAVSRVRPFRPRPRARSRRRVLHPGTRISDGGTGRFGLPRSDSERNWRAWSPEQRVHTMQLPHPEVIVLNHLANTQSHEVVRSLVETGARDWTGCLSGNGLRSRNRAHHRAFLQTVAFVARPMDAHACPGRVAKRGELAVEKSSALQGAVVAAVVLVGLPEHTSAPPTLTPSRAPHSAQSTGMPRS